MFFTAEASPFGNKYGDFQMMEDVTNPGGAKTLGYVGARDAQRPLLAPATPGFLTASTASSTQVNLSWSDPAGDAAAFRIDCSTEGHFASNLRTAQVPAGQTTYAFTGLVPGTLYYFRVRAADYAGDSNPTNQASAVTSGPASVPAAPAALSGGAASSSTINLAWVDNANTETSFHLDQSTDPNFATFVTTRTLAPDSTSYTLNGLDAQTTYYFRIRSSDTKGDSANSNTLAVTTPALAPVALYHLDETSGTTVTDSSPGPDTGTLVGGVTRVAGVSGGAASSPGGLLFDGQTGYVDLGHPDKLSFAGQMTITAWVKPVSVGSRQFLVSKDLDGQNTPFYLALNDPSTAVFGTYRSASYGTAVEASGSAASPLSDGKWHFVAGTYDGTAFNVYIDGKLVGSTPDPYGVTPGFHSVALGRNSNGNDNTKYFNGAMDEVEFFNTDLSPKDVAGLYAAYAPPAYYPPNAPTALTAKAVSPTQATLNWTDGGGAETGFAVDESTDNATWTAAGTTGAHVTTFNATGLKAGATYYFRVNAVGPGGPSGYATSSPLTTPAAADVIVGDRSPGVVQTGHWWSASSVAGFYGPDYLNDGNQGKGTKGVQFNPSLTAAGTYAVYAQWPASPAFASNVPVDVIAADGTHTVFVNEQTHGGQWVLLGTYSFNATGAAVVFRTTGTTGLVVANAVKFSQSAAAAVPPPAAPTALAATAASATQMNLTWSDATNDADGFNIDYSTDGTTWTPAGSTPAGTNAFKVTGLAASTPYYFRVRAYNSGGPSGYDTTGPVSTPSAATTVVVGDRMPGVVQTGHWWSASSVAGFYGPDYLNDGNQGKGTKGVQFNPSLTAAGKYAVYAQWPASPTFASNVPVDVNAADGVHTVLVNEQTQGGKWVLLGTYSFNATGASVVFRTTGTTALVVANAVEFVPA